MSQIYTSPRSAVVRLFPPFRVQIKAIIGMYGYFHSAPPFPDTVTGDCYEVSITLLLHRAAVAVPAG